MTPHLLIFTIGPVQSFISQARKTQDLYAGSRLLSALTRNAFELIQTKVGKDNIELIFPAFFNEKGAAVPSNPNRFALKVTNVDSESLKADCSAIKDVIVTDKFLNQAHDTLSLIPNSGRVMKEAKAQLKSHLEIFWAAIPLSGAGYAEKYVELESTLGGIKNIRPFEQLSEKGRKCNVDGIRNALFVRHTQDDNGNENAKPPSFVQIPYSKVFSTDSRLEQGEGLSAVSMYKRLYEKTDFPSTAKIALLDKLEHISKDPGQSKALTAFKKLLPGNWDEQLLFEENHTPKYFKKHEQISNLVNGAIRPEILEKYKQLVEKSGAFKPSYYALIVFDGDRMGEWMGGSHLISKSNLSTFQSTMKDLLRDYALWANTYLDEPLGKTVYAGGDDFLGFINLHHLFDVLKTLRTEFDKQVNRPLKEEKSKFRVQPSSHFSFSAGIAISHYKEPLSLVLDEARKSEKLAKEFGLSGFSMSVIRHSGGTTNCVLPFGVPLITNVEAMQTIVSELGNEHFSNQFISALIEETRYWDGANPRALFDFEAARLVKRAKNGEKISLDAILKPLETLSDKNDEDSTSFSDEALKNIVNTLRVCDFIYRATKNNSDDNT
jgi:CRISPR-associated protein Cmr2